MSAMQRTKGAAGEREVAAIIRDLTGWEVKRRVRNRAGDSDLTGIPGWSAEVKRHKTAGRAEIAAWWRQTCTQATTPRDKASEGKANVCIPVLFFRRDRDDWRAVWPVAVGLKLQRACQWIDYEWTVEGGIDAWAAVARDAVNV